MLICVYFFWHYGILCFSQMDQGIHLSRQWFAKHYKFLLFLCTDADRVPSSHTEDNVSLDSVPWSDCQICTRSIEPWKSGIGPSRSSVKSQWTTPGYSLLTSSAICLGKHSNPSICIGNHGDPPDIAIPVHPSCDLYRVMRFLPLPETSYYLAS